MLKFIKERESDYNANCFINDLANASKNLGILEAKIDAYQFNSILVPMLHIKEATSSMIIEGTQMTVSDFLENNINPKLDDTSKTLEVEQNIKAIIYGVEYLRNGKFTHSFIREIHKIMMENILPKQLENTIGEYKQTDNRIVNSVGTVVFTPPSHKETKKYMDELIDYLNNQSDNISPLIKAAILHSQFESIHPFSDGNGRVGRVLFTLYLFKSNLINFPFFYISEAISMDKTIYYNMLTNSRVNSYDNWIKYFLNKIVIQTQKHIEYIDSLNKLYNETKNIVMNSVNSPKFDSIVEHLFLNPVTTGKKLSNDLNISQGQAIKYLNTLEEKNVLYGDDRKRGRSFYFAKLIELAQNNRQY